MTEILQGRQRKRKRLWLALAVLAAILAVLLVPPYISVSHFKGQITHLISSSLGRPVRLSSVEVRLVPRPGFVLTDLTVEEDPAYGAEPVLHANTVTASIRLLSLWRGRLEIGTVSVDEASLNLVRTDEARWNLDSFLRTAATKAVPATGPGQHDAVPFPYLAATNSRINIKSGVEKLPYSLMNTDLSFWQDSPGNWRVRLRGQPVRTDLSLDMADTGVVRLEASARQTPELRRMPIHLDLEWREAQLGQLTRLVIGSDAGWRGDLTGELHLDGTADAAKITARLRASGVHRAEFAPAAPLDFDANCNLMYHYPALSVENLACDSPLGNGRIHFAGDLPDKSARPHFAIDLDRVPAQAVLDALRTLRSGFDPGLVAGGSISGKIEYAENVAKKDAPELTAKHTRTPTGKTRPTPPGPLSGKFTVEGLQLSGDGLSTPIRVPRMVLEPVTGQDGEPPALAATVAIPAGGTAPLTVSSRLALSGFQVTVQGQASIARARELARVAGILDAAALDELAGDPLNLDLSAAGPWLPAPRIPPSGVQPALALNGLAAAVPIVSDAAAESLSGTVTVHNANWKPGYLANHVEIAEATLHLANGEARWDPVEFTYGPVKGTASLSLPVMCAAPEPCLPHFEVRFDELDASALQAAILGAKVQGTMLSALIDRLRPSSAPAWPQLEGTVKADSLVLGPVTLQDASATVHILEHGAEITGLDAHLLGGRVSGTGTIHTPAASGEKPGYKFEGKFEKVSTSELGGMLGMRWAGGPFNSDGKIELSGFTGADLASSAKGTLHFEWRHGAVGVQPSASSKVEKIPAALARFDRWTGDAEIANGSLTLKQNQVIQGIRKRTVEAAVTLADAPEITFAAPKDAQPKRR